MALEVLGNIAALATVGIAALGLSTWRAEMVGRRKAEVAEEVLALFCELRDVLSAVRSPGAFRDEADGREMAPDESPDLEAELDFCYIIASS
jgi:hypothetical protein